MIRRTKHLDFTIMKTEKIFVVEDNKFFSYMLKLHLTKKINYDSSHLPDYEVITFNNTKDCLAKMDEHPAMVIVEYTLQNEEMNGAEFVLQARHTDNNTKFLVISDDWKDKAKCDKQGVMDFLLKDDMCIMRIEKIISDELTILEKVQHQRSDFLKYAAFIVFASMGAIALISYIGRMSATVS